MSKKANETYSTKINARGYEQQDGVHYMCKETAAQMMNKTVGMSFWKVLLMAQMTKD
jgi:hypothetical protein